MHVDFFKIMFIHALVTVLFELCTKKEILLHVCTCFKANKIDFNFDFDFDSCALTMVSEAMAIRAKRSWVSCSRPTSPRGRNQRPRIIRYSISSSTTSTHVSGDSDTSVSWTEMIYNTVNYNI